jgi:hypothetical protein
VARTLLQGIYYAQQDFRKKNKRWAATLEELQWRSDFPSHLTRLSRIKLTNEGYEIAVSANNDGGGMEVWHIRQDAKIWSSSRPDP